jgi:NAD(P)H-nitrite reductase large subunit
MEQIVIIGNGISGITAARHIRKHSKQPIVVVSGETDHFYSRTALMYIYMGHMKFEHTKPYEDGFWKKNNIQLMRKWVTAVKTDAHQLHFSDDTTLDYSKLIIASGSKSNFFGWPGQDLPGVQGLYNYQDLQLMEENTKKGIDRAVIVGGGLIGVEMAEMLQTRNFPVMFLVRENRFWGNVLPKEEGDLVARHLSKEHHVDLRLETELKEIKAGSDGRVCSVVTSKGEEIACQFVGLTAGVSPNVDFLQDSGIELKRGVVVNTFLETSVENVYAIGDCAEFESHPTGRRNIEQVWYTGRMMGETVAKTITGERTPYSPGVWFNSAKFFDIEYQTYGTVNSNATPAEKHFYWEDSTGKISLRLVSDEKEGLLVGMNVFGIRMRHALLDRWINEKRTVTYALEHLCDANFDPEFYKRYEKEIITAYNAENQTTIQPKKKSWRRILQQRISN